jgi:hypothetical protein
MANTTNDIYTRVNQINMLKILVEKKTLLCAAVHMEVISMLANAALHTAHTATCFQPICIKLIGNF